MGVIIPINMCETLIGHWFPILIFLADNIQKHLQHKLNPIIFPNIHIFPTPKWSICWPKKWRPARGQVIAALPRNGPLPRKTPFGYLVS
jgi:hypothetical protein